MTTSRPQVGNAKLPPEYFERVRSGAASRWDMLEADPDLAGPWRQLFSQVQSPKHVLSELLQNADDAGATTARVTVEDGVFTFEHDGLDFTEEQFQSLCRFGFSNKRTLHTIGFRGIGFKSTFSLGGEVGVRTPTLAVRFHRARFTEPVWTSGVALNDSTTISVSIEDHYREQDLRMNLLEWTGSPASLLFFKSIRCLEIDGNMIERLRLGDGPVPRSEWVSLLGAGSKELLVAWSEEEAFPADAVEEIKGERLADEITLPPCAVEMVWGLPGEQRLFVVLPTGVCIRLPFSCNAPFVQDPSRMKIKDPAVSPTNRWLLGRLGRLATTVMHGWLANAELSLEARSQAYDLLPAPADSPFADAGVTSTIRSAFRTTVPDDILLTADGGLAPSKSCLSPPVPLYDIWEPPELLRYFGTRGQHLLAHQVNETQRNRLSSWNWLELTSSGNIIERLEADTSPARPGTSSGMIALWRFVAIHAQHDSGGNRTRRLGIVPTVTDTRLRKAQSVVRLGTTRRNLKPDDWEFLLSFLGVVDEKWLQHLAADADTPAAGRDQADLDLCRLLLKELGLAEPTPMSAVVEHAAKRLCDGPSSILPYLVRFGHILAALDVEAPDSLCYVTRSENTRSLDSGVLRGDGELEAIVPNGWAAANLLHGSYESGFLACSAIQWQTWASGSKAKLRRVPLFHRSQTDMHGWHKTDAGAFLKGRGVGPPDKYNYKAPVFQLTDWDFDPVLRTTWEQRAVDEPQLWVRVLSRILHSPSTEWVPALCADVHEMYGSNTRHVDVAPIPASWVQRLRSVACLPDTFGQARIPAELLLRTPETEPLQGVEPFVLADLDHEESRPLLRLLGCRDTPTGAGPLLDRLRALGAAAAPPMSELAKWYDALDRVLLRRRPQDRLLIRSAFASEALAFTDQGEWVVVGELYQRLSEDDPSDLPIVHKEFAALALWSAIGVAERTSPELLVKHLQSWESGRKLDGAELRRLRASLRHMPERVWLECGHWLSLDGTWMPVEFFEFALFDDSGIKARELFPTVKQRAADCRVLAPESRHAPFVHHLRDLGRSLELRLKHRHFEPQGGVTKAWMQILGNDFSRIILPDESQQSTIRATGARLAGSLWHPFDTLVVTPYLDGTPAGQDQEPKALWEGQALFVKRASPAKVLDQVVAEIGRHFGSEPLQKAIRSCFERDATFVREYLADQFELAEPEPVIGVNPDVIHADSEVGPADDVPGTTMVRGDAGLPPAMEAESARSQEASVSSVSEPAVTAPSRLMAAQLAEDADPVTCPGGEISEEVIEAPPGRDEADAVLEGVPEPARQTRDRQPRDTDHNPPLIARFAAQRDYRWDSLRNAYVHPDGTTMMKGDGLLPWEHRDGELLLCSYWATEQCLTRNGVEIVAEIWERIRQSPEATGLVLIGEDERPLLLSGAELVRMVQGESVKLYPAKYRLRTATSE